jgi:Domain of unknown function (DUF4124)
MKSILILIAMLLFAGPVFADTYVWEDAHGTVNFADELGKVPKAYRKKVKIFGEEEPPPQEKSEGKEPAAEQGEPRKGGGEGTSTPDTRDGKDKPAPLDADRNGKQ